MKKLVEQLSGSEDVSTDERNLLSVAYKNKVSTRRAAWRTLAAEEAKNPGLVKTYKELVEKELEETCKEALKIIAEHLVPNSKNRGDDEAQVFYLKM
jgi:cobalamin-dependent methionine synthase I